MELTQINVMASVICSIAAWFAYRQYNLQKLDPATFFGKSVWITGASSGIGKALAIEFYKAGAHIVLSGRDAASLQKVIDEDLLPLSQRGAALGPPPPSVVAFDVAACAASADQALEVCQQVARICYTGRIACVVHNAGLSMRALAAHMPQAAERHIMDVNALGPAALTKALLKQDLLSDDGRIVLISSVQGLLPLPLRAAYSASKHAAQAYFAALRTELSLLTPARAAAAAGAGAAGMSVTIISPGYVQTNLSLNALSANGKHGKMDSTTAGGYTAEYAARQIVLATAHRTRDLWLCPITHKVAIALQYLIPGVIEKQLLKKGSGEIDKLLQERGE